MDNRIVIHPPKKQKDGTFKVTVSFYLNKKRKQRTKTKIKTSKEAKKIGDEIAKEIEKTLPILKNTEGKVLTCQEFGKDYIESQRDIWSHNTHLLYENGWKLWPFPDKEPHNVKSWEVEQAIQDLLKTYAATTLTTYVTTWVRLFNVARKRELIVTNPVSSSMVPKPKENSQKVKAMSIDEATLLHGKIESQQIALIVLIAFKCGLRLGEVCDINVKDIDFKTELLNVSHQHQLTKRGFQREQPLKSKNSYRTVPIPPSVMKAIKSYPYRTIDGYLFPYCPATVSKKVRKEFTREGYKGWSLHNMRHTYITELIRSRQFDIQSVATLAGDSVAIILKTYSHYLEISKIENAEKIRNIFC